MDAVLDVIDRGSLSISHTSQARLLVVRLSAASDQLPSSLFITGVTDHDEQPTYHGGFGDVYRASYNHKTVALKRIRNFQLNTQSESKRIRLQFCREALVWQTLQHEYILPLIGIDRETFPFSFCMVSPWMKYGTVLKYLSQHRRADVDKLLLQVAEGLGYLHSMNIVHGDLRGTNILVSDDLNACLADFGLTSVIAAASTTDTSSTNHAGSTRWMAPELIQPHAFGCDRFVRTRASDVYAYACVCLELHTGCLPFLDVVQEVPVILKVIAGERPARPDTFMSDDLWALVKAAWAQNFYDRPDIETIIKSMQTIVLNHG
ncbi:kinase-like domain-containing protein [Mycena capillaripes]|nr:kinase-like domain-containing protein [Mycena capillaripes]